MKRIIWNKIGPAPGIFGLATLALVSGCVVRPYGRVVVATPPPPVVTVDVGVPDVYAWDGFENVGLVGGVYFYLGPGNVWLRCEPWRLERFHGWERGHPDWRAHAIRNDRYRDNGRGQDRGRGRDRDHGDDR